MDFCMSDLLACSRPSRITDQRFGLTLDPEYLLAPVIHRDLRNYHPRCPVGYLRSWRSQASHGDAGSTVSCHEDKFQANLDVQQFRPEEITVKVSDDAITVEGKHEEKRDEHGFVSRHFMRRYVVPKGHDLEKVESELSSDGVLTITAPKLDQVHQRTVPIVQTGKPSKAVEEKKVEEVQLEDKKGEPKEEKKIEKKTPGKPSKAVEEKKAEGARRVQVEDKKGEREKKMEKKGEGKFPVPIRGGVLYRPPKGVDDKKAEEAKDVQVEEKKGEQGLKEEKKMEEVKMMCHRPIAIEEKKAAKAKEVPVEEKKGEQGPKEEEKMEKKGTESHQEPKEERKTDKKGTESQEASKEEERTECQIVM